MTNPKELVQFFQTIPEEQRERAVIAGGAVLDLSKAGDVDIFILNSTDEDYNSVLDTVPSVKYEGGSFGDEKDEDDGHFRSIKFYDGDFEQSINVIFRKEKSIGALLETFDLSTSRWAIDHNGRGWKGKGATKPGEPITVFCIHNNTLQRVEKYYERFGTGKTCHYAKSKNG